MELLEKPLQVLYFENIVSQQERACGGPELISGLMTSEPCEQTVVIHILPNIPRSKVNQTMKFGQLIEYNMRNIFLEKLYTKCGGETSPRPFSKKLKLSISLDQ